jgi:hypothetical protein
MVLSQQEPQLFWRKSRKWLALWSKTGNIHIFYEATLGHVIGVWGKISKRLSRYEARAAKCLVFL